MLMSFFSNQTHQDLHRFQRLDTSAGAAHRIAVSLHVVAAKVYPVAASQ
jgi:hypothetical protein